MPCGPFEDDWILGRCQTDILNAEQVQLRETVETSLEDIVIEVMVGQIPKHFTYLPAARRARRRSLTPSLGHRASISRCKSSPNFRRASR